MSEELKPVNCGCGGEAIVDQTDTKKNKGMENVKNGCRLEWK